jgi:addiction module HigA family antidote
MGITQRELAKGIWVPYQRINELANGKRGVTPSTALRLARYFGTSPGYWMNLQLRWDLYRAQQSEARQLEKIEPHIMPWSTTSYDIRHAKNECGMQRTHACMFGSTSLSLAKASLSLLYKLTHTKESASVAGSNYMSGSPPVSLACLAQPSQIHQTGITLWRVQFLGVDQRIRYLSKTRIAIWLEWGWPSEEKMSWDRNYFSAKWRDWELRRTIFQAVEKVDLKYWYNPLTLRFNG